jgi:hypothetical protein
VKPKIGVVFSEPGGEAAITPVIHEMQKDAAVELYINEQFIGEDYKLVLAGTSVNQKSKERSHIATAMELGIPTLAVLDFWSNYRERFEGIDGELTYLPDKVAVMDELAVTEMEWEGIPIDRLTITGQPAFDCLEARRNRFTDRRKYWVRKYYGMRDDRKTIFFASQPLKGQPYDYGYDEHQVIKMLIDVLPDNIDLIIRPHPREKVSDLLAYTSPNVSVQYKGFVHDLMMASDLVCGMNTELLVEACYLGCIVLSIQPGLKGDDCLPVNRSGVSSAVYYKWQIKDAVSQLLYDHKLRGEIHGTLEDFRIIEPAAPKVAQLVYEMVGIYERV